MDRVERRARLGEAGFTLLETMIAMAIMMVAFASILMVESSSINTSGKAKQMNVITMLAKNLMVETEYSFEGKTFDEYKKEESGTFPEPYQDFSWKREVKEVKFPELGAGGSGSSSGDKGEALAQDEASRQLTQLLTKYLSQSVREVTVTIKVKRGTGEQSYAVSTYWVDLNHEFALSQ